MIKPGARFWIFRHQFVQSVCPRHTGDKRVGERAGPQGFGHSTPGPHDSQASFEQLADEPTSEPARWVQIRLLLEAIVKMDAAGSIGGSPKSSNPVRRLASAHAPHFEATRVADLNRRQFLHPAAHAPKPRGSRIGVCCISTFSSVGASLLGGLSDPPIAQPGKSQIW
jgi:hypothetical protein